MGSYFVVGSIENNSKEISKNTLNMFKKALGDDGKRFDIIEYYKTFVVTPKEIVRVLNYIVDEELTFPVFDGNEFSSHNGHMLRVLFYLIEVLNYAFDRGWEYIECYWE